MADNTIHLLAPGPSMSQHLVATLAGKRLGAVGVTWTLAPHAEFLASSDIKWWNAYPEAATNFRGRKFSAQATGFTELLPVATQINSGVLALHACIAVGATHAVLHGFDMHGTHYFGDYTNGLANTSARRREVHLQQYRDFANRWKRQLHVINATKGSRIDCFPFEKILHMNTADHLKLQAIHKKLTGKDEDLTPSQLIAAISDHVEGKREGRQDVLSGVDSAGNPVQRDAAGNPVPAQGTRKP